MATKYTIWILDDKGNRLLTIADFAHLEIVKNVRGLNSFLVVMPIPEPNLIENDRRIEIIRRVDDHPPTIELSGFVQKIVRQSYFGDVDPKRLGGSGSVEVMKISGYGAKTLLSRRIIAYAAGTSQASKSGYIDDMMKEIMRENFGQDADSDRDLTASGLFYIGGNASLGPSTTKRFAWSNVYDVLLSLQQVSRELGTEVFFDVIPRGKGFEFATFVGQRGTDRRIGTPSPVVFGEEYGNLVGATIRQDYFEEINYVYAGGQGEGADRDIEEDEDTALSNATIWSRKEGFADARNESTVAGVQSAAAEMLIAYRPVGLFSATIKEHPSSLYGVHWELGDRVTIVYKNEMYDAMMEAVNLSLNKEGKENIIARFELT